MNPFLKALQTEAPEEGQGMPPMVNPASENAKGDVIFVPKSMFEKACKKGEKVTILAEVQTLGDKIGLTPLEVGYTTGESVDEESGQNFSKEEN